MGAPHSRPPAPLSQTYPEMRRGVLSKLRLVLPDVSSSDVSRVALWLLGQYSESDEEVQVRLCAQEERSPAAPAARAQRIRLLPSSQAALHSVRECLGPLPLTTPWETFMAQVRSA